MVDGEFRVDLSCGMQEAEADLEKQAILGLSIAGLG
jgi:hypothetical protein